MIRDKMNNIVRPSAIRKSVDSLAGVSTPKKKSASAIESGSQKKYVLTRDAVEKLWDKICLKFATKQDVRKLIDSVNYNQKKLYVQSGLRGPIYKPDTEGVVRLKYEDWVEKEKLDSVGNLVISQNASQNALTAAAAAKVIRDIRKEIRDITCSRITIVDAVDPHGHPVVKKHLFNVVYLTPAASNDIDEELNYTLWNEWVCVQSKTIARGYVWKYLGSVKLDLNWVKDDIILLNQKIETLENQLEEYSEQTQASILEKCVQPLEELTSYIASEEFYSLLAENIPVVTEDANGVMSSEMYVDLEHLIDWASNTTEEDEWGGAITEDQINEIFESAGF